MTYINKPIQLSTLNLTRWFGLADDVWFSFYFVPGKANLHPYLYSGLHFSSHLPQQYPKSTYPVYIMKSLDAKRSLSILLMGYGAVSPQGYMAIGAVW